MQFDRFTNCLRIVIVPDENADARIDAVVAFCRKYRFGDVMLMLNAEEYNLGHMTEEEAQPWLDVMARAAERLRAAGIGVSLNNWIEIGHLDRGRTLKEGQNFGTMADETGRHAAMVACPLDGNWRKYHTRFIRRIAGAVRPDVYWIEDDFRLHNHAPLVHGGCFCDRHMAAYCDRLGVQRPREQFVARAFAGTPSPERTAWLDVSRETMEDLAGALTAAVKSAAPDAEIGLMSSPPESHCVEGRDWRRLHEIFAGNGRKIDRIHLPCYIETSAKEYYYSFNVRSMVVRAFLSDDTYVYPELENAAFSPYAKNARFLAFQLESAVPLLIHGMTYDIFDFVGNGPLDFGYGEAVAALYPYLDAITRLGLKFSSVDGVTVPLCERAAYNRVTEEDGYAARIPDEFETAGYLSAMGIAYRPETGLPSGRTVFLFGHAADNFDDDALTALFNENYVVADGGAALILCRRGLGRLIGAVSAVRVPADSGRISYEQAENGFLAGGIADRRATAQEKAGDWTDIRYIKEVTALTGVYDRYRRRAGNGTVLGATFAVLPFVIENCPVEQFNELRRCCVYEILDRAGGWTARTGRTGVAAYTFSAGGETVLMAVNATLDGCEKLTLDLKDGYRSATVLGRDGIWRPARFTRDEKITAFEVPLPALSTAVLRLTNNQKTKEVK